MLPPTWRHAGGVREAGVELLDPASEFSPLHFGFVDDQGGPVHRAGRARRTVGAIPQHRVRSAAALRGTHVAVGLGPRRSVSTPTRPACSSAASGRAVQACSSSLIGGAVRNSRTPVPTAGCAAARCRESASRASRSTPICGRPVPTTRLSDAPAVSRSGRSDRVGRWRCRNRRG